MKHDSIADSLDIGLSVSITSSNSESQVITDPSDMVETVPAGQEKVESQLVKNDPILGWKSPGWLVTEADLGADVVEKVTTDIMVSDQVPRSSFSRLWSTASKYVLSPCSTVMAAVVIALVVSYLVFVSFLMVEIYHFL